jgi:hypothetical protein
VCPLLLQVFLYVSLQKRVVGLAVVEPIKHAYKLAAPGECGLQQQQQQQPHLLHTICQWWVRASCKMLSTADFGTGHNVMLRETLYFSLLRDDHL